MRYGEAGGEVDKSTVLLRIKPNDDGFDPNQIRTKVQLACHVNQNRSYYLKVNRADNANASGTKRMAGTMSNSGFQSIERFSGIL